jgi:hypothetical protein
MKLITTAVGETYRNQARSLAESLSAYGWKAELLIASDTPIVGLNAKVMGSSMWGGRDLKSGFALLFNIDPDEPVCWVDADCLAVGQEPDWISLAANTVAGMKIFAYTENTHLPDRLKVRIKAKRGTVRFSSFFLQFDSAKTAVRVSKAWNALLAEEAREGLPQTTDEFALMNAMSDERVHQIEFPYGLRDDVTKSPYPRSIHHKPSAWAPNINTSRKHEPLSYR